MARPFFPYQKKLILWLWPWLFKKLNLGRNFWIKGDKAFILHMWVPLDKTFLSIPKILTLWPWPWLLTYFSKNWTLAITFISKETRLSYYICGFLWQDLSVNTKNFDPVTLTWAFDLLLKKLNLGHQFWTKRDKAFILHLLILCDKTFPSVPKIFTVWPWPSLLTHFWKT